MATEAVYVLAVGVVLMAVTGTATNPGLKLGVSQHGLDYTARVTLDKLSAEMTGKRLPDMDLYSKEEKKIYDLWIERFSTATSRVDINNGKGITWSASGIYMKLNGHWRYYYRKGILHFQHHGRFEAKMPSVSFSISITLGVDGSGRPTISTIGCTANPGKADFEFHGGASWIYNLLFSSGVERKMKDAVRTSLCKEATEVINKDLNEKLATMDVLAPLGHNLVLDYRLTDKPIFGSGYVELRHKGEIFWEGDPVHPPFGPERMPDLSPTSKMVYIWLSDYVFNSLLYTTYTHGVLEHNLTRSMTSNKKVPSQCVGPLCQQGKMAAFGPNYDTVLVTLKCTQMPSVHIVPEGIKLTFIGEMGMYATGKGEKPVYLVSSTAAMKAVTPVALRMEGNTIKADFSDFDVEITGIYTKVGNITEGTVLEIFNVVVDAFIKPELKKLGDEGLDLPQVDGVAYVSPVLELAKNAILVAADFKITF